MSQEKLNKIFKLINQNNFDDAEKFTKDILKNNTNNYSLGNILSIIYALKKDYTKAILVLNNILKRQPDFLDALTNLANIYRDIRNYDEAILYYKKSLEFKKDDIFINLELAKTLDLNEEHAEAEIIYKKILTDHENNKDVLIEFCKNKIFLDDLISANKIADSILEKDQNDSEGLVLKSLIMIKNDKLKEAEDILNLAKEIDANNSQIFFNLAGICAARGNHKNAIKNFLHSIKLNDKTQSKYNLSLSYLAIGEFNEGWKQYKNRASYFSFKNHIKDCTEWNGKKFDSLLIVRGEQGIGDEIIFSSMFNDLLEIQQNITVTCDKRLIKLFETSFKNINFIERGNKLIYEKNFKYISSGDLGQFFRKNLKDFKQLPWIKTNPRLINKYKKLIRNNNKIKVGIGWSSLTSKSNKINKEKSITINALTNLLPNQEIDIINLQYGNIDEDLNFLKKTKGHNLQIFDTIDYKNDIDDLAAIILNCDFVISTSNFTACLSGSLGKKTFALDHADSTWIWTYNKKNMATWFSNVKIIKQSEPGNWENVYEELKNEIKRYLNT